MFRSYNESPYNFATVLKKQKSEKMPPPGVAVSMVSANSKKEQSSFTVPTPSEQPTQTNKHHGLNSSQTAASPDFITIASIMRQLMIVRAKQTEVKQQKNELAKTETDLENEANNLTSLILLKVVAVAFPQNE